MNYKIKLEIFEGPLDLLLYLVKKDHLNIYDIPITAVTKQYMQYLELMQSLDLNIAGEFLVMAATLLQIKSKMLLPAREGEQAIDEEDDPRQDLVRQLLEYEKFKEVAENLRQREISQRDIFKRPKTGEPVFLPEKQDGDAPPVYFEASIFDLISAFSKALEDAPKELFYQVIKDEYTVEDKVHNILHLLLVKQAVSLSELFTQAKTKMEIIVTFLAILELIKLKEIVARQKEVFGEIEVARNDENIIPYNKRQSNEAQQEEN